MKRNDLKFSDNRNQDIFLKQCFFNEFSAGYDEAMIILETADSSSEVIEKVLASDTMRGTQIYAELSKGMPDHWKRVLRDLDTWHETYSDAGGLKIGSEGFSVIIPNGYGDGKMHFAEVGKGCFNADMLNYWTSIEGHAINIYDYDCAGGEIVKTLDGRFGVYQGYGFVVFERWGDAA